MQLLESDPKFEFGLRYRLSIKTPVSSDHIFGPVLLERISAALHLSLTKTFQL